jgi:adenylate cyclase
MLVKRSFYLLLLPLFVAALFILLDISRLLVVPDGALYDLLLSVRRTPKADASILLVDVDDEAARLAGAWPWPRDLLADGLVLLKEMNARYAVVDMPLGQRSAPALDASALRQDLPAALDKEFLQIQSNIQSLYDAIRRGSVRPQDSARYVNDIVGLVAMAKVRLFNAATGIERDDDALLGQALGFFGNAYVPFDLLSTPDMRIDADLLSLTTQRQSLPATIQGIDPTSPAGGIRPAVLPAVRGARGGGFAGIAPDADGIYRAAPFAVQWHGTHFVSVATAAALDMLGAPSVRFSAGRVLLQNVTARVGPDSTTIGLSLDDRGRVLLAWPVAKSGDGFRHISWARLIEYAQTEKALAASLRAMDDLGYLSYLRSDTSLLDAYEQSERLRRDMLAASSNTHDEEWVALRSQFFTLASQFLNGDAEARILADADKGIAAADPTDVETQRLQAQRGKVAAAFSDARMQLRSVAELRASLQAVLPGSFCIISLSGEEDPLATGKTPFGVSATEATAEAALVNTLLNGARMRAMPSWIGYLVAALLVLLIVFMTYRLGPSLTFLVGLGFTILCAAGISGLFILWGDFLQPSIPLVSGLTGSIAASLIVVGDRRRATRAVRAAFAGRLSDEGLRSLLSTPEVLSPRGARHTMTVIALAEKGLSGGSAMHEPRDVMRQIAAYHGAVGEVVRSLDGMIGGAGVDRLMAYFGAPLARADHVVRACRAACRIRAVEKELNVVASPLLATRMGIDTGECIVGDFGSRGMPGYAVVGAPADCAARLEGLNGTFGTSLLITERVRATLGEVFLVRRLGIARIAEPNASVRVYELVAEAGSVGAGVAEVVNVFERGLLKFEEREFAAALALFSRALSFDPNDGPARAYAERCRHLLAASGGAVTSFPT